MHVLDLLVGRKHGHGHKVSFDKVPEDSSEAQQAGQQQQTGGPEPPPPAAAAAARNPPDAAAAGTAAAAAAGTAASQQSSTSTSSSSHNTISSSQQHSPGESHKLKSELRKLLKRAAVSFRDLNISVHDASHTCLAQMHDTATGQLHDTATGAAAPHTLAGASVLRAGRQRVEVEQKKLCIIMVGLPGRGKTFVCNKLKCYLNWLGHPTAHFNVGQYRRKIKEGDCIQDAAFFDHNNPVGLAERERAFQLALADMMGYLRSDAGQVAIFDATNSTQERREKLSAALRGSGIRFIFIENICNDPDILQQNYLNKMMYSPDYSGIPTEKAVADFVTRIAKYEEVYEPITDRVMHYIKLTDMVTGRGHIDINRISGYLPGKIVFYLMQVCKSGMTNARKIWLTRHGESVYNQQALIGGDSPLSPNGQAYAELLPDVILSRLPKGPEGAPVPVSVWTSTLQRTIQTAAGLPFAKLKWKALDEIDAGICDGMTYAQIADKYPAEFEARKKDKLRYRYPRGESYLDLVQRLEPVISEMEREGESIVIVGHQAVLRVIFGYLMAQNQQAIPSISIPLHTVIELTPRPDGTMGVEYIPVPVHLSDASLLHASSPAAVASPGVTGGGGSSGDGSSMAAAAATGVLSAVPASPLTSPISPAVAAMGLDPAAAAVAAAAGGCPFRQDAQQGPAADIAAASAATAGQPSSLPLSKADAAVLIADHGDHSSSSQSTGTTTACELQQQQEDAMQHAESLPCYYSYNIDIGVEDSVGELPLIAKDEIQRMSSCSSGSSLALMQHFSKTVSATAGAPAAVVVPQGPSGDTAAAKAAAAAPAVVPAAAAPAGWVGEQ